MLEMVETEKITINLNVVDLGKIDLLVSQGFYSNRTDFIRTGIRNQLTTHVTELENLVVKQSFAVGVTVYSKKDLEKLLAANEKIDLKVVGMLVLGEDIDVELALKTINSVQVKGIYKASAEIKKALS